ncbi:MAG: pyridoxamine 5'-phosphate oxidase family protein [Actinomycetota bacterium]|nr:pyridoxamine 5'-phosphate oxidase family protein [Actinomycetota bacterium]
MQTAPLSDDEIRELLLQQPLIAKLATQAPDGTIRITPLWFGPRDGAIFFNTWENSEAVENLRKGDTASVMIDSTESPYYGVHFWGTATVEGPKDDAEGMADLFSPYFGGDREASLDYTRGLVSMSTRVYVRFEAQRQVTWDFRQA